MPIIALLGVTIILASCGPLGSDGPAVTVSSEVHPVLIRNEHNVLLRVTLVGKPDSSAQISSFEFDLAGTDDPGDIDVLEVFHTGGKPEFAATSRFGEASHASNAKVTITGRQPLGAGTNVFWLSCRLKPGADLAHKVGAALVSVATTSGTVAPPNQVLRRRVGVALRKHNDDGVHTYRIPALATAPRGTLHSVYDMRRRKSRDLQEDIDIGLSRSTDGGSTWEPPRVIMDMGVYGGLPQEQNGVSDPGIVIDQKTGEIIVFAVWMWGKPGKHQWNDDGSEPGFEIGRSAQLMMVRSKDDGLTWTKPENMTRKLKKQAWWLLAPAPQQGINLRDGTLVLPAQGRDGKGVPFATIMLSRDHGATWTVGEPAFSGGSECQAVELSDGSIMLNIRNDHERFRAVYVTRDRGKTWLPHATNRNTLIEPNCNGSLYRMSHQGRPVLLFANPQSQKARTHHTIQVSLDEGTTWPSKMRLLLDEGRGRGYPSLSRVDDRRVGIVYEGSGADIVFERLSMDELLPTLP